MSDATEGVPVPEATPGLEQPASPGMFANFSSERVAVYQSPLPPVEELEGLKQVDPSFPECLLAMVEKEQDHKHATELQLISVNRDTIRENQRLFARGQSFGFTIGTLSVSAGVLTVLMGEPLAGGFIGTGGVAALAAAFIYGSRQHPSSGKIAEAEPPAE